jgi:chain length determinant protein EpsF
MSFSQFLLIVRYRWKTVVALLVGTLLLVIIVGLVFPTKYRAEASVVLQMKPDPVTGMMFPGMMSPTEVATQIDIIQSDRVARRVIHNLKLDQSQAVLDQWRDDGGEGTVEDWLIEAFSKQLDILPSRESNVITIRFKAIDAKFAATLANAFAQAYLDTALELKVDPAKQNSGFFDEKAKDARAQLEAAQAKLGDYQREHGVTVNDERLDVETSRLNDLSAQLVALQTLRSDTTSRQAQAAGGNTDQLSDTLNNPVIANIKIDLSRAQASLGELSQRLGPNHPSVQQARANVNELQQRLAAETARITGSVRVASNINNSRVAELQAALDAQRQKVLQARADRDHIATLQHDVEAAQRNFETISLRQSQTSLESQSRLTDVVMLSAATPPLKPVFPRWGLNLALGTVLGLLLGIGFALLRELMDRRIRTTADVVNATGLPILGVLPRPMVKRRRSAISLMGQRVISGRLSAPQAK